MLSLSGAPLQEHGVEEEPRVLVSFWEFAFGVSAVASSGIFNIPEDEPLQQRSNPETWTRAHGLEEFVRENSKEQKRPTSVKMKRPKRRTARKGRETLHLLQKYCCVTGCQKFKTNRLKRSLKCTGTWEFKEGYIVEGWEGICHYHYFNVRSRRWSFSITILFRICTDSKSGNLGSNWRKKILQPLDTPAV